MEAMRVMILVGFMMSAQRVDGVCIAACIE